MKRNGKHLNVHRRYHPALGTSPDDSLYGYFKFKVGNVWLFVISSGEARPEAGDIAAWEHVSVSCSDRTPTWQEMCAVKDLFWRKSETVIQFHPKESEYVNHHEFCLHLWKHGTHELPPNLTV